MCGRNNGGPERTDTKVHSLTYGPNAIVKGQVLSEKIPNRQMKQCTYNTFKQSSDWVTSLHIHTHWKVETKRMKDKEKKVECETMHFKIWDRCSMRWRLQWGEQHKWWERQINVDKCKGWGSILVCFVHSCTLSIFHQLISILEGSMWLICDVKNYPILHYLLSNSLPVHIWCLKNMWFI